MAKRVPALPSVPVGWWDANISAELNPVQVVARVEELMPGHPALPRLRKIAKGYKAARRKGFLAPFRCHVCRDSGFVEIPFGTPYVSEAGVEALAGRSVYAYGGERRPSTHAGATRRCKGPRGVGCPYNGWRLNEDKRKRQEAHGVSTSDEFGE